MIPTVYQDIPLCFAVGGLLALSAHRQLMAAESVFRGPWFRETALFAFLIFLPVGIFFYVQWPAWSWLYTVDPASVPTAAIPAVWLSYPVAVLLGFVLTGIAVRGDSPRFALVVPSAGLAALIAITLLMLHRFLTLTTYAQYQEYLEFGRGELPYIWSDPAWPLTMAGMGFFVGVPLIYLLLRNLRDAGEVRPRALIPPQAPD